MAQYASDITFDGDKREELKKTLLCCLIVDECLMDAEFEVLREYIRQHRRDREVEPVGRVLVEAVDEQSANALAMLMQLLARSRLEQYLANILQKVYNYYSKDYVDLSGILSAIFGEAVKQSL